MFSVLAVAEAVPVLGSLPVGCSPDGDDGVSAWLLCESNSMGPRTLGRSGSVAAWGVFVSGVDVLAVGVAVGVGDADGVAVAVGSTEAGFVSVLFAVVGTAVAVGSDTRPPVSELT